MNTTTFKTKGDVVGYEFRPVPVEYRGFVLQCVDVSGPTSYGYAFALIATRRFATREEVFTHAEELFALESRRFARSVTLWFTGEKNHTREFGCFDTRYFREGDVTAAQAAFREAVDGYWKSVDSAEG